MKGFRRFEDQPQDEGRPLGCFANGCPCRPVVVDGGRDFCRYHAMKPADKWPGIVAGLREHDWYIGFIGDLMRLYQQGKDADAKGMVRDFWIHEPDMLPTEHEARYFPHYLTRLHADLGYRVGATSKKPGPIEPQAMSPAWQPTRIQTGAMPEGMRKAA